MYRGPRGASDDETEPEKERRRTLVVCVFPGEVPVSQRRLRNFRPELVVS